MHLHGSPMNVVNAEVGWPSLHQPAQLFQEVGGVAGV